MAQFYKIVPNSIEIYNEVNFLFIIKEDVESLKTIISSLDEVFDDGCTLEPVTEKDKDFEKYVKNNIIQVLTDIDKFTNIKTRLTNSFTSNESTKFEQYYKVISNCKNEIDKDKKFVFIENEEDLETYTYFFSDKFNKCTLVISDKNDP